MLLHFFIIDKMSSRARSGQRAIVRRPLSKTSNSCLTQVTDDKI